METGLVCHFRALLIILFLKTGVKASNENNNRLISHSATATQSSTFNYNGDWSAGKVVDGCYERQCIARTDGELDNWIQIDLQNVYKISSLIIYAPTEESCPECPDTGIKKLDVTMSKTKDYPQCVRTNVSTEGAKSMVIIRQTNNKYSLPDSRFITLRKKNHELIIAEVEVFGECLDNYCGINCSEFCFCKTPLSSEGKANGQRCSNGCLDGWQGERCNKPKCSGKTFGLDCHYQCHCWKKCDPWTGECVGPDKRCSSGWFGPSCQRRKESPIFHVNHTTIEELSDGNTNTCYYLHKWMNRDLLKFIQPRSISHVEITYLVPKLVSPPKGISLKLQSTNGDAIHMDFKRNVRNPFGCGDKQQEIFLFNDAENISSLDVENFEGNLCEIQFYRCSTGFFGLDCNSRCHCAQKSACNTYDGLCPNGGICELGWSGHACDKKCPTGTFGAGCMGVCYCHNNEPCHPLTGKCPNGCNPGWLGDFCNKKCPVDWFGPQCQRRCGHCAGTNTCHHITGNCSEGCAEGWEGPRCLKECPVDWFGPQCQRRCGHCAGNNTCHHITGNCSEGCVEGWEGPRCLKDLQMLRNIPIITGSFGAFVILIGLVMFYVFRIRKKRESNTVSKGTMDRAEVSEPLYHIYDEVQNYSENVDKHLSRQAEAYESLIKEAISIKAHQFTDIYRKMLSIRKDGKSALYYAFQTLLSDFPGYESLQPGNTDDTITPTISYKELIVKHNALPEEPKAHAGESSMQMLKIGGLSFVISDESTSRLRLWEAVLKHNVSTCISIGQASIKADERLNFGDFTIECTSTSEKESFTELKIKARQLEFGALQHRNVLVYTKWDDFMDIPIDPVSLLDLVEYLCDTIKDEDSVLIQCEHNRNKAVLVSVITATLLKMKTGVVDIMNPIYAAKRVFPSSLSTYEQFKFIHDVVLLATRKNRFMEEIYED